MFQILNARAMVATLALPLVAAPALSQSTDAEEVALREVVVTARSLEVSTPLALARYGNDVEFVTSEEIRNHGFVDAAQALEMLVPGAFVSTQAGAFSYINLSLQGSRTGDVLWTVDGVRINNRLYNGTSPADTLPASMIERMEVLKGGQGLLYGTQAVAGVVNIVTRAFADEPGGAVSVGGDSRDGLHLNGYARGAVADHRFVGWASKDSSDGYSLHDVYQPGSTARDRAYDVESFGLKYGYDFTDRLRLTLQGVHTEAALDYPTTSNSVSQTSINDRNEDTLSARFDVTASESAEFYLKGYLHDWDTRYYPLTDPADSAYWGYRDFGLSAATRLTLSPSVETHLGYDFQNYRGRDEELLIEGLTEKVHAFYGQLRSTDTLSTRARFTAGLRHNRTGGRNATVWSASAVYHLTESLYVEGLLGTAFQLPDIYQLYAVDPFDTRGNPDLAAEKSRSINLAIGGSVAAGGHPVTWQITGWKRRIDQLIVADDSNPPAGFDSVFVNLDDEVNVSGGELLLRAPVADAWSVDASYTYSREIARGTDMQLADRPRRSAKLGLDYAPAALPFGVNMAFKYAGTTRANVTGVGPVLYGDAVVTHLGAHWFADGSARRHRLGLRVENLFDKGYATRVRSAVLAGSTPAQRFVYRNLGAPRTAFVNYTYDFH